jgi:acyl dehydratase
MLDQVFGLAGVDMQVNYGADTLRFPAVVPVRSRIRAGVELLAVRPSALGHHMRVRVTVERDGGEKPVCVVEVLRVAAP